MFYLVEKDHHQSASQVAAASNDEYKTKLLNLLLAELEANEQSNDADDAADNDSNEYSPFDKRMSYRYGKRMSYRYGKRSAMPYRFGKRGFIYDSSSYPSAQQLIELLKLHDNQNEESVQKRMSYRYGK